MDRRFFENYEDDLSKNAEKEFDENETTEDFQKIDEEEYVLKENYVWSDQEEETYAAEDIESEDDSECHCDYSDSIEDTRSDCYSECYCDFSDSIEDIRSDCDSESNYDYSDSMEYTTSEDTCGCNYGYYDSDEQDSVEYRYSRNNKSCTLEKDQKCKKYYERGKKEGYHSGYEAGARDAIKAAYKAGYRCALRRLGYRI